MSEIKKTLAIFKSRWPEVGLLVILPVISSTLMILRPVSQKSDVYQHTAFCFVNLLYLGLMIIAFILNYGFMRTIFLDETKPHSPAMLLKLGSHFF